LRAAVFARTRTCGTRPAAEAQRVPKTIVVIPTYNERDNVPRLIPQVLVQAPDLEVLVVDDQSPDGTGALVSELARQDARIHLLSRAGRRDSARPIRTASPGRSRMAPTSSSRWTPTSRTRPRCCPASSRGSAAATWCSAPAT
jgi:cellulose synthase/poly-beta-1,6-N-acetylglucosamine synthase-like glycosyltransferase